MFRGREILCSLWVFGFCHSRNFTKLHSLMSMRAQPHLCISLSLSHPRALRTRLNPHSPTLEPDEYVDSVRLRLSCAGRTEPVACAACSSGLLDSGAAHASCCALGDATRDHNVVTSQLHAAVQSADHTAEMEVPAFIPGTDLRPADVLTSALGNAYTALDILVCSPHA